MLVRGAAYKELPELVFSLMIFSCERVWHLIPSTGMLSHRKWLGPTPPHRWAAWWVAGSEQQGPLWLKWRHPQHCGRLRLVSQCGAHPGHCIRLGSSPANSTSPSLPSCDNQKGLWTLPNAPWGGTSPGENQSLWGEMISFKAVAVYL